MLTGGIGLSRFSGTSFELYPPKIIQDSLRKIVCAMS